jgi:drug/metabolite transporter (DMT)-like permease
VNTAAQRTPWKGIALVLVGAFCFSLAIPFVRWINGLDSRAIACFRALFGFLFLSTFLRRRPEALDFAAYRSALRPLLGLSLAVSLTVTLYTFAIRNTSAAAAALLVNSAPIYVAVLAPWVLGEARARLTWPSLALALVGIVLLADPGELVISVDGLAGLAAAALSGFTYAIVMMISRQLRGRITPLTQTLWGNAITCLVLLPWGLQTAPATLAANLHLLIPLGIFTLGLSYLLFFVGLEHTTAQVASVVALFEPVSGILLAIVFFAEVPNPLGWIGGGLILLSIYLISR